MDWLCPKCKSKLENLKCVRCNFEAKIQNNILNFAFDLDENELAEDIYRQKENLNARQIFKKKTGTINYFLENISGKLKTKGRILDIGAGYCWLSGLVSRNQETQKIFCTDVSQKALEIGQEISKINNYQIDSFVRAKADFLPFPNHYFDFVISSAFLHHVRDISSVLSEISRIIKPGGEYIAFLEPASSFLFKPVYKLRTKKAKKDHPGVSENVYTFREWKKFFEKYKTSFVLIPPEHKKWNNLWNLFRRLGLTKYLLFSNILIKVKF